MSCPSITAKHHPGNYFGRTVWEEMQVPGLLENLKEAGVIWDEWIGDDHSGMGDFYPQCKPRHYKLMIRAVDEHQDRRNDANCRACRAKWGSIVEEYCKTCFFNINRRRNVTNE